MSELTCSNCGVTAYSSEMLSAHYRMSHRAEAAAPSAPQALDVERLRDALRRVYKSRYHERFAEPLAAEYAALTPLEPTETGETPPDMDEVCQCGHTRAQHESRWDAPDHCTHRCAPPWWPARVNKQLAGAGGIKASSQPRPTGSEPPEPVGETDQP